MAPAFPGRYAAQSDRPFAVSLAGMRVSKISASGSWPPLSAALSPMLAGLKPDPGPGLAQTQFSRMARFGLGAALHHRPRTGRLDTARSRIGRSKSAEGPTEQP
jgi:hypothetical protein